MRHEDSIDCPRWAVTGMGPFADGFGGVTARAGVWAIEWGTALGGLAMRECLRQH